MPPSANWYGSSLSALHSEELAYCAQNAIVVLHLGSHEFIEILSGHSSRTTCVVILEKEGSVFVVSASQDRCVHVWKRLPTESLYSKHRVMSKRPAEIRSISSDCHGNVVLGDKNGNVFLWDVAETGSKIQRLGQSLKTGITSVACCTSMNVYNTVIAVGCMDGSVYLMEYEGREPILCAKMDTEIHSLAWCEYGGNDHCLLALSSKSGSICVLRVGLRTEDQGSGVKGMEHEILGCFENNDGGGKGVRQEVSSNRYWGGLDWVSIGTLTYLLSSSHGGKIFAWNAERIVELDGVPSPSFKLPENHTRAVFSVKSEIHRSSLYITSIGLDRICSVWTVQLPTSGQMFEWKGAKLSRKFLGLGAHPTSISVSYIDTQVNIAIGCGDGTIRITSCNLSGGILKDDTLLWKDIPSPVTIVSWHPDEESVLCFGCTDGTVGMVNLSDKKIHLGTMRHEMPVAALAWVSDTNESMRHLQSWCTSGVVLVWPQIGSVIEKKKSIKGPRDMEPDHSITRDSQEKIVCLATSFAEHLDRLALVYANGCVQICQGNNTDILWSGCLENPEESRALMVTSTTDEHVIILSDSGVLESYIKCDESVLFCTAKGSITESFPNATPTCINAHASHGSDGKAYCLVVVGFDSGMIAIYMYQYQIDASSCTTGMKKVGVLKGHSAPVLQCQWGCGQQDSIVLFTSSQDQSIRLWNIELKDYISALLCSEDDVSLQETTLDKVSSHEVSIKSRGKHKDGSTSLATILPAARAITEENLLDVKNRLDSVYAQGEKGLGSYIDDVKKITREYDIDIDVPISAVTSESYIDTCSKNLEESAKQSKSDQLSHRRTLAHRAAALQLWEGNIGGALQILLANDALTADFVCFAAGAGRDAWIATARAYADQLERKGDVHLAALHLTQIGDIVDACTMYERHKMLREAATLASCRLPSNHSVARRCIESYAKQLSRTGNPVKGSLVLASLGEFEQAQLMLHNTN